MKCELCKLKPARIKLDKIIQTYVGSARPPDVSSMDLCRSCYRNIKIEENIKGIYGRNNANTNKRSKA